MEIKMRQLIAFIIALAVLGATAGAQQPPQSRPAGTQAAGETLIRNATILTVTRGTLAGSDVLIRGGKIAAVGGNLQAGAGARVIDATGKYVMPGIIDAHSHSMMDAINELTLSVTSMARIEDVL